MLALRASIVTRCQVSTGGGGGPEVNKFEQVFNDGHQMSLVGEGKKTVRSHVGGGLGSGQMGLYSEVQCIMGNGHMGPPPPYCGHNDGQTRLKTLPSRNFVGGW